MSDTPLVEIPKTMLILKSHPTALGVVETFLRNRGWKIYSTANLKEALVQIVSNKPSYVLISVDHSNKKVRALPKLLAQAFPVACIAFAETQSSASFKILNEAATEYRVYPPVTGPAIERCVNKYLKDQQTRATVETANDTFKGEGAQKNGNDTISIKGGGPGNISVTGGGNELGGDAGRILAQLMGEEAPATHAQNQTSKVDTNQVFAQPIDEDEGRPTESNFIPSLNTKNSANDNLAPSYLPNSGGSNNGVQGGANGFGQTYVQKGSAGPGGTFVPPTGENGGWGNVQNPNGLGPNYTGNQQDPNNPNDSGYQQGGPNGANPTGTQQGGPHGQNGWGAGNGNDDLGSAGAPQGAAKGGPGKESEDGANGNPFADAQTEGLGSREYRRRQAAAAGWAPMEDKNRVEHIRERRARSDANQTLIARGTQKSLEESIVVTGDGAVKEKAQDNTSAACIVVESEKFSGYLVAVMGKNRQIDQAFINSVKTKLFKFLKDNGEVVSDSESMDIKIKQVDFEPWALDYAEFLRKSVHEGNEVAMAFFPRRPIKAILEDSEHKDMAKISLNELQGDRQVEFDLYVYLPNNNKYVLYTPKGGVFYNKQMDRLKKQGVTHMHVQKEAAALISKYKAQNYLNDMIDDHEQKQAEAVKQAELAAKIRAS